jgi:two-component system sensor histidine kinase KdpD
LISLRPALGRLLSDTAVALGVVGLAAVIAELLFIELGLTRVSLLFLAAVVVAAALRGKDSGRLALLLATIVYALLLADPRYSLSWPDEQALLPNLLVFLAAAAVTGHIAGQAHAQAGRASARALTFSTLFKGGQKLSAANEEAELTQALCASVRELALGEQAFLILSSNLDEESGLPQQCRVLVRRFKETAPALTTLVEGGWRARPLTAGDEVLGLMIWNVGDDITEYEDRERFVDLMVDLGAASLSRAETGRVRAEMELAGKAHDLREALLSSVSHDFRSPLAAIIGSATSLLEYGHLFAEDVKRDLLVNIQEESERLNVFVGNLLSMTRLEGDALELNLQPIPLGELLNAVVVRFEAKVNSPVSVSLDDDAAMVLADSVLLHQVVYNVLDNAIKYSAIGNAVTVRAHAADRDYVIEISDHGPGLPVKEYDRVFGKFYRSKDANARKEGTGLGLSIAKGFLEAMGGTIVARPRRDGLSGLSVIITIPVWMDTA